MKTLLAAGALVLALTLPAMAGDCADTIESVLDDVAKGQTDIVSYTVVDDPLAIKGIAASLATVGFTVPADTTRILFATFANGHFDFGLEVGGCLSNPLTWPQSLPVPMVGA